MGPAQRWAGRGRVQLRGGWVGAGLLMTSVTDGGFPLQLQLLGPTGSFMTPIVEVSCGRGLTVAPYMGQSTSLLRLPVPCAMQESPEVLQLRDDVAAFQSECQMLREVVEGKEEMVRQLKSDILRLDYKTETERV